MNGGPYRSFPIGTRLRHAREASQLSLTEVAERSGLSKGFISRVERDETSPSVVSLIALCDAIGLTMEMLFKEPRITLIRASDRPQAVMPGEAVSDTLLTAAHEERITVIETIAAPGGSGGEELYSIASDCEVCYVLEGQVEFRVAGRSILLGPGDAVTFDAQAPHTWRNTSQGSEARLVWIIAPALADPLSYAQVPSNGAAGEAGR